MTRSPDFCREQAAYHRAKADAATLPNVRIVAERAVATWLREAELAEMVVARRARMDAPA